MINMNICQGQRVCFGVGQNKKWRLPTPTYKSMYGIFYIVLVLCIACKNASAMYIKIKSLGRFSLHAVDNSASCCPLKPSILQPKISLLSLLLFVIFSL
uniref:Uncharacterized protein n=1 Tax=Pyxicephalus adspersus TaxID=30357 RepID=A0AAV3A973_PYXAD|nr:TPA: hypothetical protein GDO54_014594 [Pyxicephalus adspersus]